MKTSNETETKSFTSLELKTKTDMILGGTYDHLADPDEAFLLLCHVEEEAEEINWELLGFVSYVSGVLVTLSLIAIAFKFGPSGDAPLVRLTYIAAVIGALTAGFVFGMELFETFRGRPKELDPKYQDFLTAECKKKHDNELLTIKSKYLDFSYSMTNRDIYEKTQLIKDGNYQIEDKDEAFALIHHISESSWLSECDRIEAIGWTVIFGSGATALVAMICLAGGPNSEIPTVFWIGPAVGLLGLAIGTWIFSSWINFAKVTVLDDQYEDFYDRECKQREDNKIIEIECNC